MAITRTVLHRRVGTTYLTHPNDASPTAIRRWGRRLVIAAAPAVARRALPTTAHTTSSTPWPPATRPRPGATRARALTGDLATAEPKRLRYRLLHTAARLVHGQRRRWLRVPATWPWADQLTAAFTRITAIPAPG